VIVGRVAAAVAGGLLVLWTLVSAMRTVVVPRAAVPLLTRVHFMAVNLLFRAPLRWSTTFARRDAIMALYAPLALLMLPGLWVTLVVVGCTGVFWGSGVQPLTEAFVTSGSSLLTLGFVRPPGTGRVVIALVEAGVGLGLVSLMISYLPTLYSAFSRREALVGMLEIRAGLPPSPTELLIRFARIDWLQRIGEDLFQRWEEWFIDVEESHTSHFALVFFRSPHPERSWVTAAGCVLDTAAITASSLDRPRDPRSEVMLRSGFFALRRIADVFNIPYDPDPQPSHPISITRAEFDATCDELAANGVALKPDLDQAWRDFAGWRVNYDTVLVALAGLVAAPPAMWSSDRPGAAPFVPRIRARRRR
jgi:hypothetical protein